MTAAAKTSKLDKALERSPPSNLDAEKGVLGSILLDPRMTDDVSLIVQPSDFASPAYARVYRQMLDLHNSNRKVDLTLLMDRLKSAGDFDAIGGMSLMVEIAESVPTAANATWYAKIVRDRAAMRAVIHASTETLKEAYDDRGEPDEVLQRAESRIFSITERRYAAETVEIGDVLIAAMDAVDARQRGERVGIQTGYPDLDKLIFGLGKGQLIILAGRAHMGKTAAATCFIENVVFDGGKVLFVSLEMHHLEIGDRLLAQRSGVPLERMQRGTLTPEDRRKIIDASSQWSQSKVTIDDTPTRSVSEIAAVCRRQKRKVGLDLVVIDYLTLIEPDNPRDPRQEQVARISRRLKAMARELQVPVMVLAQLNREVEKGGSVVPKLSHLRESGAIEQDADVVIFVHRPEYYATTDEDRRKLQGKAEFRVAKARNAKLGIVPMTFLGSHGRFESAPRQDYQQGPYDFGQDDPIT